MPSEYRVPLFLMGLFLFLTLASSLTLFLGKRYFKRQYQKTAAFRRQLDAYLAGGPIPKLPKGGFMLPLRECSRIRDEVRIPKELAAAVAQEIELRGFKKRWLRQLHSPLKTKRAEAASFLSFCPGGKIVEELTAAFKKERSSLVRLRIAGSLVQLEAVRSIPQLAAALNEGPDWFRYRLTDTILMFGIDLRVFLEAELEAGNREALPLAISFSRLFMQAKLSSYLVGEALDDGPYAVDSVRVLVERLPQRLDSPDFLAHKNDAVRGLAWGALAHNADRRTLFRLADACSDASISESAGCAISEIIRKAPAFLPALLTYFESEITEKKESSIVRAETLAAVLASRMDFFIYGGRNIDLLMTFLIKHKRIGSLASFLRSNRNQEIEDALIGKLRSMITDADTETIAKALDTRFLEKLNISPPPPIARRNPLKIGAGAKAFLWVVAAMTVFTPVSAFALFASVPGEAFIPALRRFVLVYTNVFMYYSFSVNGIYLLLLCLSVAQLIGQFRIWSQARTSFLATERMMAPVSIIVPAFREEASIVENVRSLLSLNYPLFEIIVVCDGSPDATLERVIEAYAMEKSDAAVQIAIPCSPIRGVYKCAAYPYLTLVDKVNGGKADALNAGINFAKHDYLCCVDADSLLESDALTKIMYQVVADEKELVACGGNIIPVNDCEVRMGSIRRYAPPKAAMARFQTVEYLRAFLAGRLGWAYARSLLIISGAFGIFKRQRVMEIGGYLTGEGTGKFDTVGEDMELVVRLSRHMREKKAPFRIGYAFNANCWTEVPEDFTSLRKQRSRWHRGLLEILLYHRRCAFNPRYGTMGTIALPYFFIFEVVGPFFELFGWATIPLAAALGVLNGPLSLMLLAATIMFGISISTASLAISEFQVMYYSPKETVKLLAFSVLENFGYRQAMSALRVFAYFSILAGTRGWGSMKRKGFSGAKK